MYLVSRCDKGLFKSGDYEEILKVVSKLPEIDLYDINAFIRYEKELQEQIHAIVKPIPFNKEIRIVNLESNSEYSRFLDNDTIIYD